MARIGIRKGLIEHYASKSKVKKLEGKLKIVKLAYKDNGVGYYLPKIDKDLQELFNIGLVDFESVSFQYGSPMVVYYPKKKS